MPLYVKNFYFNINSFIYSNLVFTNRKYTPKKSNNNVGTKKQ